MQVQDYLRLIIIMIIIIIIIKITHINFHLTSRPLPYISVINVDTERVKAKLTAQSNKPYTDRSKSSLRMLSANYVNQC